MSEMKTAIKAKNFTNLTADELVAHALRRNEGVLSANQALSVTTGKRTGRSPKDRFIVKDHVTEKTVDWGSINQPIAPEIFHALWDKAKLWLNNQENIYKSWLQVGAEKKHSLVVKVVTQLAWHQLFTHNLFIRPEKPFTNDQPEQWTLLCLPDFKTDPVVDRVNGDAAIILNFSERCILILGTHYAGEMKKAMFSVMNFLLPEKNILPMHCAANVGEDGDTALFFGLSGTGKTTLSADPLRWLIGDDEHGWSEDGVFNFEGGCYAKCIDLSQKSEPVIWDAICQNAVMENVVLDQKTKQPDYHDSSLTENTRAAYPLEHIPLRAKENKAGLPSAVIFLTCDLYGVLPPVARLSRAQAAWYFLSGYTALVGSTEVGSASAITETFSTCFGAPFFARPAQVYADLLLTRLDHCAAQVFLVNTGWTGGCHGEGGQRFSIPTTRSIVRAIVNNQLHDAKYHNLPGFNFEIPDEVPGVDKVILNPQNTWKNPEDYDRKAQALIQKFIQNFEKFSVSDEIKQAAPILLA